LALTACHTGLCTPCTSDPCNGPRLRPAQCSSIAAERLQAGVRKATVSAQVLAGLYPAVPGKRRQAHYLFLNSPVLQLGPVMRNWLPDYVTSCFSSVPFRDRVHRSESWCRATVFGRELRMKKVDRCERGLWHDIYSLFASMSSPLSIGIGKRVDAWDRTRDCISFRFYARDVLRSGNLFRVTGPSCNIGWQVTGNLGYAAAHLLRRQAHFLAASSAT